MSSLNTAKQSDEFTQFLDRIDNYHMQGRPLFVDQLLAEADVRFKQEGTLEGLQALGISIEKNVKNNDIKTQLLMKIISAMSRFEGHNTELSSVSTTIKKDIVNTLT